ncbi:9157_t:CDS:2, partial [Acaulospora morrowiae]
NKPNIITRKSNGAIPREWITPLLSTLPDINETNKILINKKIQLSVSLLDNSQLSEKIKILGTHFHFDKLPQDFITKPKSPEPKLTLLPILI